MTTRPADRADDLTLLLMLKDRLPFTLRWMSYAERIGLPFRVLVADGSLHEGARQALADPGRFPHVAFEYVRYPADRTYADFYAKIEDALSRVRTPFVALSDNDDFWIVDGLRESLRFLRAHPEYATCGGQMAYFWVNGPAGGAPEEWLYSRRVHWKCSRDAPPLPHPAASGRIRTMYDVYYHVHRTADLRARFRAVRDANPRDIVLVEMLVFLLTAIAGPTALLDVLYLARQSDSPGSVSGAHEAQHGDWLGRVFHPSWAADVAAVVEIASAALAAADALTLDEARARIRQWFRISVGQDLLTTLVQDREIAPLGALRSLVGPALAARLPRGGVLRAIAKQLYRRTGWISYHAVRGLEWRGRPVANAGRDFRPVQTFLAAGAISSRRRTEKPLQ